MQQGEGRTIRRKKGKGRAWIGWEGELHRLSKGA